MAKICLSLTGKTLEEDMKILDRQRKYIDIAELRVDCLDPDERFLIRRFPEMAGIPVILTIRRSINGGHFNGGEGARIILLAMGMAYAEADRRLNFAYMDLEEDLNVPGLEEAARTFGTRIIRSWYNMEGVGDDLAGRIKKLRRVGDELVKISVAPRSLEDVIKVYKAARKTRDIDKIFICMGEFGLHTGITAELLGSKISYASPGEKSGDASLSSGPLDPKELAELYRSSTITKKTRIFAAAAYPLKADEELKFFNTVFKSEKTDAVYIPLPADSLESLMRLADEIDISGISLGDPYRKEIIPYLAHGSKELVPAGACNTLVRDPKGWTGYNTLTPAFSDSLLEFLGRKDLRGRKLTIAGSGDAARAAAAEVYRLRGKALMLTRPAAHAQILAKPYRFAWADPEHLGTDLIRKYSNVIIQTDAGDDLLEFYRFSGKEAVMDMTSKPGKSRCLRRAQEAGCHILDARDMQYRQARYQYTYFMGREFPPSLVSRMKFSGDR